MSWLSKLFGPKQDWRLVKTIKYPQGVTWGNEELPDSRKSGDMYYHLFESNLGNRKIQIKCTITAAEQTRLEAFAKSTDLYHEKIYRWLAGRGDPDIQRYDEVDQEETMHRLKGTIEETF